MNYHQRGIYIEILAAAWDSDEPGTLPLPIEIAARSAGLDPRSLRDFMSKSPGCLIEIDGMLVQPKLREQWLKLKENADSYRDRGKKGADARWLRDSQAINQPSVKNATAFASASAIASAVKTQTPERAPEEGNVFAIFWKAYPRKTNESAAFRAWASCIGIHNHIEEILTVIMRYETSGLWDDLSKVPSAENFILDKRWRDEVPQRSSNGRTNETPRQAKSKGTAGAITRVLADARPGTRTDGGDDELRVDGLGSSGLPGSVDGPSPGPTSARVQARAANAELLPKTK